MKVFIYTILGSLTSLLAISFGGSNGYEFIALMYGICLLWLFNKDSSSTTWPFLIGATLALELLGDRHIGQYTLFCFVVWIIDTPFRTKLRFTSTSIRYSIAAALLFTSYHFFFSSSESITTWLPLGFMYAILLLLRFARQHTNPELAYAIN